MISCSSSKISTLNMERNEQVGQLKESHQISAPISPTSTERNAGAGGMTSAMEAGITSSFYPVFAASVSVTNSHEEHANMFCFDRKGERDSLLTHMDYNPAAQYVNNSLYTNMNDNLVTFERTLTHKKQELLHQQNREVSIPQVIAPSNHFIFRGRPDHFSPPPLESINHFVDYDEQLEKFNQELAVVKRRREILNDQLVRLEKGFIS